MNQEAAEETLSTQQSDITSKPTSRRLKNTVIFFVVVALWLLFDIITKQYFNGNYTVGQTISDPIIGLFRFRLVHNTGAAWGLFGDSTTALGVMSMVVCVIILAYFFFSAAQANRGEVCGLALVLAGGLGNGIDRFGLGYVVDFIEFTFIQFPVFNIADIGVTCGFVIFILGMFVAFKKADLHQNTLEAHADKKGVKGAKNISPSGTNQITKTDVQNSEQDDTFTDSSGNQNESGGS